MAITLVDLTGNVADILATTFDPRRTKVWVETNVDGNMLTDTDTAQVRLGTASATIAADGSFTFADLIATNSDDLEPSNFQYRVFVDYADTASKARARATTGWFSLTGTTDLTAVIEEQYVPPTYLTAAVVTLSGYVDDATEAKDDAEDARDAAEAAQLAAETARDDAVDISGISTSDAVIASRINAAGSATDLALVASGVAPLGKQTGVDPTGVSECASAINTALTGFAALGVKATAQGTFKISSTVTIAGNADFSDATFDWTGANTGTAVQIGVGTSGTILFRKNIVTPRIVNSVKVGTGWAGSSIGIKASNTYGCRIIVQGVKGFVTGYYAYGLGTGNVYNDVQLLHLENNKRNLVCGAGTGGWSNSNTYRLGLLAHESAEGSNVSGVRQILLETATNLVNGNLFLGGSVEGNTAEYHLDCDGLYNKFDEIRWENSGGCRAIWRANSARNVISFGYSAQSVVETHVAGSGLNRIYTSGMSRIVGTTTKALHWLENTNSSASGVDAVMDPGATLAGSDAATAYRMYRSADEIKFKRAADSNDRLKIDGVNGRVYFGNAAGAIAMYLGPTSTTGISINAANFYFGTDNANDIGLISSLRPRYVRAGTAVVTGAAVTGSRPAAATAGIGAMFYDTTLSKPIWSTGSVWKDAAGTTV